jgi:hypothetical protein
MSGLRRGSNSEGTWSGAIRQPSRPSEPRGHAPPGYDGVKVGNRAGLIAPRLLDSATSLPSRRQVPPEGGQHTALRP